MRVLSDSQAFIYLLLTLRVILVYLSFFSSILIKLQHQSSLSHSLSLILLKPMPTLSQARLMAEVILSSLRQSSYYCSMVVLIPSNSSCWVKGRLRMRSCLEFQIFLKIFSRELMRMWKLMSYLCYYCSDQAVVSCSQMTQATSYLMNQFTILRSPLVRFQSLRAAYLSSLSQMLRVIWYLSLTSWNLLVMMKAISC